MWMTPKEIYTKTQSGENLQIKGSDKQMITTETRQMSFNDIQDKTKIRYIQILNRLDKPKTAKELAVELFDLGFTPSTERNYTAPRLTELEKMGYVKAVDKKKCEYTGKTVAVYERTQSGFEAINYQHIPRIDQEAIMQEKCSKCDSEELFVEIQGNRRGLYCGKCGKWQKWITKQELQIAKFKGYKILGIQEKIEYEQIQK